MKTRSKILLSTLFLIIAGCTTTPNEMRADAKEKGTVLIELPFEVVRENFLIQAKKCNSRGLRTAYPVVVVDDVKPGEHTTLNVHITGAPGMNRVAQSFDIRKSASGKTEISWFIAGLITKDFKPTVEYWSKGLEGRCGSVTDK
jgi:hypothetical protein